MKFLTLFLFLFVLRNTCFGQIITDDQKAIVMIKTYYTNHEKVWREFFVKSPNIFDKKLDSLQKKYCTKKLRLSAEELLNGDNGSDIFTKDTGIDTNALKTMTIDKDPVKNNIYVINYNTLNRISRNSFKKMHVKLRVGVMKVGEDYKIASIDYP